MTDFPVVHVEPMEADEWERWRDVRLRALLDEPDAFGSSYERECEHGESDWRGQLERGSCWLAVDHGDVGLVAGGMHGDDNVRWVYSMWVAPPQRGTGVAEALLASVVGWAIDEGVATLGLDVTDRVPRARRFYERFGFVANGVTLPLPRDPSIQLTEMVFDLRSKFPQSPDAR